jgi:hypothetical protein
VWIVLLIVPILLRAWKVYVSKPDDRVISDHNPVTALNNFLGKHPAWKDAKVHVYWKQKEFEDLQMKDYVVTSVQVCFLLMSFSFLCLPQLSGTCWLHAVVVLQHLLVVKGSGRADHKKVLCDSCRWLPSHYVLGRHPQIHCHAQGLSCQVHI